MNHIKSQHTRWKPLVLAQVLLVWGASNLHGQTAPTISVPPANQTVLPGANVTFSVVADGPGPFSYQWQFNGTNLPNNIISTVAGGGSGGDGGPATNASLSVPTDEALDASGNLFITDLMNNRVRKVNTNGIISTVAGSGAGSSNGQDTGDGGKATNAAIFGPAGVTLDTDGNLYIADSGNRVRKVGTNGLITTVAGNGKNGYSGDGGAATNAMLLDPAGVAIDLAGNLYIAEVGNSRIRKVDTNGLINTVAGNGSATNSGDGGAATNASLDQPSGVALDAAGNMYIADEYNERIRKVDTNGIITTVAGNGIKTVHSSIVVGTFSGDGNAATNAGLNTPDSVALDSMGNLYIADNGNGRIRKVDTNGIITTVAGNGILTTSGDGGAATNASLAGPGGVAFDGAGNLYIADNVNNRIRKVLLSAGYPSFNLSNINASNAGSYSVLISSPYGSVTSAVATLTVTISNTPPQIIASGTSFGFLTNEFGFNVTGTAGQTLVVDGSTDLVHWIPLFTNTGGGSPFYFFDPAWTNFPWRFYRARLP